MVRMSTEASDEAVATIGTSLATSRTVKATLVLVVSASVVATSRAADTRAWRYVWGSSNGPTITR